MRKTIPCFMVMVVLILSFSANVFAAEVPEIENVDDSECLISLLVQNYGENDWNNANVRANFERQEPDFFTIEYQETVRTLITQPTRMLRAGETRNLAVTNQQQLNSHYCGLACASMTAQFMSHPASQGTIATYLGYVNRSDGLFIHEVRRALNNYGAGAIPYSDTYVGGSISQDTFNNIIRNSVNKNRPVVALVNSNYLAPKNAPSTGHYVCIKGFRVGNQGSTPIMELTYNDPYNNSAYYGTHTTTFSNMRTAIRAHRDGGWIVAA